MDTATHITMGIALGGIATLDPAVQNDPTLFHAVFVGVVIASHAPDFDTILKFRSNAVYIRNHRGITHSIPAVIIWGVMIAGIIHAFVPQVNYLHLWTWTFLAVVLHVFVDIFNAYGTQAYRPFTNRWVAYGFINTFDPYIFSLHILGILIWMLGANPGFIWILIYITIILYYIKRYLDKREIIRQVTRKIPETMQVVTSPTMKQHDWRIAITTKEKFYVGVVHKKEMQIVDEYYKIPLPDTPVMRAAQADKNVAAFLSFSPVYRWEVNEDEQYTEVRFIDLRYRSKGRYPFVAVVHIDEDGEIMNSYTGWIFSEQKLQSKLSCSDTTV